MTCILLSRHAASLVARKVWRHAHTNPSPKQGIKVERDLQIVTAKRVWYSWKLESYHIHNLPINRAWFDLVSVAPDVLNSREL